MNFSLPEDTIHKSLVIGGVAFVITFLYLSFTRPDFVTRVDDDKKKRIDFFLVFLFSLLILITTAIIIVIQS